MATCQQCGSELTSQYCDVCGAKAQEERAHKAVHKTAQAPRTPHRNGPLAPNRIVRTTGLAVLATILIVGGALTGFYVASSPSNATVDLPDEAATLDGGTPGLSMVAQAEQAMEQGVQQMQGGDRAGAVTLFRKSISAFEAVLKSEPDNLYARSYLGLVYYYAGDSKNAVQNEQTVLQKDPNYLWAIFNIAWMYETGGKKDEAIKYYEQYLAVVDKEQQDFLKYAEQPELIPRQIDAAKASIEKLKGSAGK